MRIPARKEAEKFLHEAQQMNPGPWVPHSRYAAQAAQAIAREHPRLDPDAAYVMGLLHDIGRREGVTALRHAVDGYRFLLGKGFDDAARISITHMFPLPDIRTLDGRWDCSADELNLVKSFIADIDFTEYDRLIQTCDAIAMPDGFCLIEKRMVDVALRYGVSDLTLKRWQARFEIMQKIEQDIGRSIYTLLPGVVENTFQFERGPNTE